MGKPAEINHVASHLELDHSRPGFPVLDLVHLSRQTFGDHALETEILTLFDSQAAHFSARLAEPRHPGDAGSRADLAHTLKGSSRAVGAFAVGAAAEAYEDALRAGDPDGAEFCAKLMAEIESARAAIAALFERA
ncbi:MAG: histidine phosphotransferase [Methylocystis sp.]|nr:MAG: histidine phosphotransferase [Methylocystis sp.]